MESNRATIAVVVRPLFSVNRALLFAIALLLLSVAKPTSAQSNGVQIAGPVPWIDVRAYGAKGDGTTDDRPSIQSAINSCPTSATPAGCTIFFPLTASGGYYKIGASGGNELTIPSTQPGITLRGQCAVIGVGTSCSKLSSGQTGTSGLYILKVGDGASNYEGLRITDLSFNDASTSGTLAGAIYLYDCRELHHRLCILCEFPDWSLRKPVRRPR